MNYQEFLDYIKENILEVYKNYLENQDEEFSRKDIGDIEVDLHKVIKNNGIVLDGITLRAKGETVTPNIYLNSYFESYQMGKPIAIIMDEIIYRYQKAKEDNKFELDDILDFSVVKNQIVLRLVNYEKNKEQLEKCPHKKYLDLAITFRYIVSKDALGIASSLISNQEFEAWDVSLEDLYQIALFNTMREFPWKMESLAQVVTDCFKAKAPEFLSDEMIACLKRIEKNGDGVNMFVLTNDEGLNGATCILYDNVIKNFAKVQDTNIFLLPSSVHEMMLVPENEETNAAFLSELVRQANMNSVGFIDLLSDNIYYYDKDSCQLLIFEEK